ncbi:MAG: ATP-binding cassette domain-containing protein [Deltaproteobacteria bacterium]|nr:ATP-binding cassette domain-containing protein [Deltaproteobacteria bacterium]
MVPGRTEIEGAAAVSTNTPTQVARIRLDRPALVLGREGAEVVLDSPVVSRRHAVIERTASGLVARDLRSMNGTFIDGRRLEAAPFPPTATLRVGPFLLRTDGEWLLVFDARGAFRVDAARLVQRVGAQRTILRDVSLSVLPGELVALVGSSGAGKSTLMRALAGQAEPTSGVVMFNGDNARASFDLYRSLIGYVPQEDIVHQALPVRRALNYAARLRLPSDMGRSEIRRRIDVALSQVDLTEHAAKRISQLSGGQRKRVSIAVELLADPGLFFLDEPTSGLDPGLEKKMMQMLRRMAEGGRTVVVVTHATQSLEQCHQVGFVADGRLVYFGPPSQALAFFGVASGEFADIYTRVEGLLSPSRPDHLALAHALAPELSQLSRSPGAAQSPSLAELWELHFRNSPHYRALVALRLSQAPQPAHGGGRRPSAPPRASSFRQLWILTLRYCDLMLQDKKNLFLILLQAPLIAWLVTLVAQSNALVGKGANPYDAKVVLFMLATVAVWFGVINSVREITKESVVLRRDRLAGLRLLPYLLSKLVVLGLLVSVQSAALMLVVSQQVVFPTRGLLLQGPYEMLATTVFAGLAGLAVGLAISAASKTPDRAVSVVPLVLIPQILFSGVLFPLGGDDSTIRILSWFTLSRWTTDAYGSTAHLTSFLPLRKSVEYAYTSDALLTKWGILGGICVGCMVLAAIALWRRTPASGAPR